MKTSFLSILGLLVTVQFACAFDVPTDEQLAQVLASPSDLPLVLEDASPEQAAEVVFRLIRMVGEAPGLDDVQKNQVAVLMTARAVFHIEIGDADFVNTLLGYMPDHLKPLIAAAGVAASRDSAYDVRQLIEGLAADETQEELKNNFLLAAEDPKAVLGDDLYYIIAAILPHVPIKDIPAATLSIPLPPPPPFPVEKGGRDSSGPRVFRDDDGPGREPPVPPKYPGQ